jgi:hypothetical protein
MVSAHLGDGYAFLATALGTIRHHDLDAPPDSRPVLGTKDALATQSEDLGGALFP